MAGLLGEGVSLRGFSFDDFNFTWNITGTINKSADIGKVMSQDTTAANSAKLAGADEPIIGVLVSYEDRVVEGIKVGTVASKVTASVFYTGTIPALGAQVCGGGTPGYVKAVTSALPIGYGRTPPIVVEQNAAAGTVVILFV